MIEMPNPFESALEPVQAGADDGHWPATADPADPVAVNFTEPALSNPCDAETAAVTEKPVAAGPFESRFILDVDRFMADLDPPPAFLLNPSPEYLRANEMMPMLAVLAGH